MISKGISQNSIDSVTCIPNNQLRNAIKKLEECQIIKEQLIISQENNGYLLNRIEIKDSIINIYKQADSLQNQQKENFEYLINNLNKQAENNKKIWEAQTKIYKKRKWIYGGVGLLSGIIIGIIAK
jgi:hypothetical protein